jgi:hypothetical protein
MEEQKTAEQDETRKAPAKERPAKSRKQSKAALLAGPLPAEAEAEIDDMLADLGRQCGPAGPNAQQRTVLMGIRGVLISIWRCNALCTRGWGGTRKATERLMQLNNCLRRQIKALELPAKPKSKTFADLLAEK